MQHFLKTTLPLAAALAFCLNTAPALADSTSSASSASSTSVGSSSASLGKSSDSSSTKDRVAQGHYTVVDVAELADQPDLLRVRLQPQVDATANANTPAFDLVLPRQAAGNGQLAVGQTVAAEHRPYGLAFAAVTPTGTTSPFFLVLEDAWYRELESRPVVL